MNNITLGSLFDGIGGWQIAARRAGVTPSWSSEIEKFPCIATKTRFPATKQLGDITRIDGGAIPKVDIVTMGSPCQDLSMAGRREGLAGKRSGLFIRAVELIQQMRTATNGHCPKIAIWENVPGAFTSNKGLDFKTVLESFTETHIPIPRGGRWASAGMVRSSKCNVVWRALDSQFWGVAQRRRRIFLVVDYTKGRTEEILFKPESVPGDIEQSQEKKCNTRYAINASIDENVFDITHPCDVIRQNKNVVQTLTHRMGTGGNNVPLVYARPSFYDFKLSAVGLTLKTSGGCNGGGSENIVYDELLRKLTPLECERLQGLPDNWTLIDDKLCSDSARYKAIGNGMAQPCADFVIRRVAEFLQVQKID